MYELFSLIALLWIGSVLTIELVLQFTTSSQMEDFDLDKIQEDFAKKVVDQAGEQSAPISDEKFEATSAGGTARSLSMRKKQFEQLMGESILEQVPAPLKAAAEKLGFGDWLDSNPDLATWALERAGPYLQQIMTAQGNPGSPAQPQRNNNSNRGGLW